MPYQHPMKMSNKLCFYCYHCHCHH
jgi:hypothetical protein